METPVLNKRQKKLSLSAKKQKKETIKNVVATPYELHWPLITDKFDELKAVLNQNLPRVRTKKVNVPWNILKNTTKEDRRTVRNEYLKKNAPLVTAIVEPNLVFGVNEVAKSLEIDCCSIVLVADVNPRLLVQHILDLAVLHSVPILVVPGMKQILEKLCGLQSMAIAIKKDTPEGSNLGEIIHVVTELSKSYPVNEEHINSKRKIAFQHVQSEDVEINEVHTTNEETPPQKCHLYRSSLNNRVFVPKISNENITKNTDSIEFMSFGETEVEKSSNDFIAPYIPLIVKKVKGNKNRAKNKVEQLKRKRK